jgi:hypothetical protein
MGEEAEDADLESVLAGDQQVIGHFDVGPAGVGPMVSVTTGEFYPSVPVTEPLPVEPPRSD